jgi:hypothetical protein
MEYAAKISPMVAKLLACPLAAKAKKQGVGSLESSQRQMVWFVDPLDIVTEE